MDSSERAHFAGPTSKFLHGHHPAPPLHSFPHKIPHSRHRSDIHKSRSVFRHRLAAV